MLTLIRRNETYYSRLRVPSDVLKFFPRYEIVRSLKTTRYRHAKSLFNILVGETERLFTMLRISALDEATIRRLVDDYKRQQLHIDDTIPPGRASRAMLAKMYADGLQSATDALLDHRGTDLQTIIDAKYLLHKAGNDIDPDDDSIIKVDGFKALCREVALANKEIHETVLQRTNTGDSDYDKTERAKPQSHLLSVALRNFVDDKKAGKRKREEKAKKLLECFQYETKKSDIKLSAIDNALTRKVAERLQNYPLYRGRRYNGKSLSEIYKLDKVEYPSIGMQEEELFFMSGFYQYCIDKLDGLQRNFAKGLSDKLVPDNKMKASDYRDVFRTHDIIEISRELQKRKEKGELIKNPHLLFIPLIGLFQGMRANEICQLHINDLIEVDGLMCFSICEDLEGQSIKNANSRRINPVHPALIELGLVRLWESQKAKGYSRLWEGEGKVSCSCYRTGGRETHAHYFCKWFNGTFKKHLQLSNSEKQSFHSTRHTFINWFRQNLNMMEHGEAVTALSGHLDKDDMAAAKVQGYDVAAEAFVTYGKDLNIKRQYETLKLLDYGIDLSKLVIT